MTKHKGSNNITKINRLLNNITKQKSIKCL